jgi:anti-anti-sigma factor
MSRRSATAPEGPAPSLGRPRMRRPGARIVVESTAACWVVHVRGEIDIATSPELQDVLERTIDASDLPVIADLSAVEFMDASGLHVLIAAVRRAGGGRFAVAAPSPAVRRLLEITGLRLPARPARVSGAGPGP